MSEQSKQVGEYYDKLWDEYEQTKLSKPNSRHRTIFKNLKKAGLKNTSTVLEIGCGIGSLSGLIINYLTDGFFTGADISSQTIAFLRKKYSDRNRTDFVVTDMTDFSYNKKFDFIIFPDVLEHIPVSTHPKIFSTLKGLVHENSVILINNPEPLALEWVHQNRPDLLQIIDQPLHVNHFAQLAYDNGFYIEKVEPYSLHTQQYDYQNIIIRPRRELKSLDQKAQGDLILANIKSRF
ncbi:MAG: class I SAM-dependent methyltransferase [Chitinophagales bacterium]